MLIEKIEKDIIGGLSAKIPDMEMVEAKLRYVKPSSDINKYDTKKKKYIKLTRYVSNIFKHDKHISYYLYRIIYLSCLKILHVHDCVILLFNLILFLSSCYTCLFAIGGMIRL